MNKPYIYDVKPNCLPIKAHPNDACFDLFAYLEEAIVLVPGQRALINCGFKLELPESLGSRCYAQVFSRSGLAHKNGIIVLNAPGIIDNGYAGDIMANLCNFGQDWFLVQPGMRIAQMRIEPIMLVELEIGPAPEPRFNGRGHNGHGSTGL